MSVIPDKKPRALNAGDATPLESFISTQDLERQIREEFAAKFGPAGGARFSTAFEQLLNGGK